MGSECTTTTDRVCLCKPGYFGQAGECSACVQEAGSIVRYSDVAGSAECKMCEVCNSVTEVEVEACTPSQDTKCQCKDYGGDGNINGCGQKVQESTGENRNQMGLELLVEQEASSNNTPAPVDQDNLQVANVAATADAGVLMPGL